VRASLRAEMRRIHDATGMTTIFVTHDLHEATELSDRMALINAGRVEQIGAPDELEDAPASPFVFETLGACNRLPCEVVDGLARFDGFCAPLVGPDRTRGPGVALFRPDDTLLDTDAAGEGLAARVVAIKGRGVSRSLECQTQGGYRIIAEAPEHLAAGFHVGQTVGLTARRAMLDSESKLPETESTKEGYLI